MNSEKLSWTVGKRPSGWWVSVLIFLFSLLTFHYTKAQLTGTWIGVHSEWDSDFVCPLPAYLRLNADSTYQLGLVEGTTPPIRSTWAVQGNRVRLDTIHYAPGLVQVEGNLLRIGTFYPMVFRRFQTIPLDSIAVYQQLSGRVWQSDSLTIALFADGRVSLENRTAKNRTVHFWRVARLDASLFLVIRGSPHERDGNYKPLWQLTSVSPTAIQAIGWNGRNVSTETFRLGRSLTSADSCRSSGFQPCDNCFSWQWYYTQLNAERQQYVKEVMQKHYHPIDLPGQSGLLRARFVVNCQGERGLFDIAGFDTDYCPFVFDKCITEQVQDICRRHVDFEGLSYYVSGQTERRPEDKGVSLTFRLKDGCITDVLP
ncbi:hypothetical protein [Spirosoma montaniterrae]|uniref:Uncharacterized protein n=1 Tax=Spirosoma montaniterrae TaxID=1178516 RepID=A0A1P9X0I6_9BACT|nr:hypothetical protein [Spirosoma montaniterrae]AQG81147.1 hypothetical protein AWR27_18565 [Spirosoma montaniterrae]